MSGVTASNLLSYAGIILEAALLVYVVARGHAKRHWDIAFYLATSVSLNGFRFYSLQRYGVSSSQYWNCYWTTDLMLVVAAFIVVASFFRRACSQNPEMWQFVRLLLGAVLIAIAIVSVFSLSSHKDRVFSLFVIEFSQNLYFASLVLTTLLYLMTLKMEVADERLGMLVCGLGIEFAGPAAGLALFYLARGAELSRLVGVYFIPLCDVGMILTWFYAVSRVPGLAKAPRPRRVDGTPAYARGNISHF